MTYFRFSKFNLYFPNYNQLPIRKYKFRIHYTFCFEVTNNMIDNIFKRRSLTTPDSKNELIHIAKAFMMRQKI